MKRVEKLITNQENQIKFTWVMTPLCLSKTCITCECKYTMGKKMFKTYKEFPVARAEYFNASILLKD